jgi:hypothetical protein
MINNQLLVYYLPTKGNKLAESMIRLALNQATESGDLKWESFKSPSDLVFAIDNRPERPDVVLAPEASLRLIRRLDSRIALFNLSGLFKDDNPNIFAGSPFGSGPPSLTTMNPADGKFGGLDKLGWEYAEEIADWLAKILGQGQPSGQLGGRVGCGIIAYVIYAICGIVNAIVEAFRAYQEVQEKAAALAEKIERGEITFVNENGEWDSEKVISVMQGFLNSISYLTIMEPEDSGRDFILLLGEYARKKALDASWNRIKKGKLSPTLNDVKKEFIYWLNNQGLNGGRISGNKPIPQDDETGYAFFYFLWQESKNLQESKLLQYLSQKGVPIDPDIPPANAAAAVNVEHTANLEGSVNFICGKYDGKKRKLDISFLR